MLYTWHDVKQAKPKIPPILPYDPYYVLVKDSKGVLYAARVFEDDSNFYDTVTGEQIEDVVKWGYSPDEMFKHSWKKFSDECPQHGKRILVYTTNSKIFVGEYDSIIGKVIVNSTGSPISAGILYWVYVPEQPPSLPRNPVPCSVWERFDGKAKAYVVVTSKDSSTNVDLVTYRLKEESKTTTITQPISEFLSYVDADMRPEYENEYLFSRIE